MLVDNINTQYKVHEWITKYTREGTLNVITGYFTIGALAYISAKLNENIQEFKFVLGDIVHTEQIPDRTIDLLNENITVEAALQLSTLAKEAVTFLKQQKVNLKTLEPNFCHAKAYLFQSASNDPAEHYFLMGSSNLTEAGIGLKKTMNVELNIGGHGTSSEYDKLTEWFDDLWTRPQAHEDKTVDGKKIPFKQYLINEIEKLFITYTPKDLYYKVLFELFGKQLLAEQDDPNFTRQIGRLENTVVYNALYGFQRKGTLSLINMLQHYSGAILADAVGLGKTWSALAVMKFFQLQGFEVILLCPKKLEQNWRKFLVKQYSCFEDDHFNYTIRFHTDLQDTRLESYQDGLKIHEYFQSDRPKLLVIDESHHLRNAKSNRYKYLVETLLKANDTIKVLMLSATPINNTLLDIRNQFKLMVQDEPRGFKELLGVQNIDYTFRSAQKAFHEWRTQKQRTIGDFIKKLPANFFKLTDSLTVARTRRMIEGQTDDLIFPKKTTPVNLFVTPGHIGHFETFEEMVDHFPTKLSGYQPSFYVEQAEDVDILRDEKQRDYFLVKMMYILMVKRLESSWFSFKSTVEKVLAHHEHALQKIQHYQEQKKPHPQPLSKGEGSSLLPFGERLGEGFDFLPESEMFEDDEELDIDELTLGKKRRVKLSDIDRAGNLDAYKHDLKQDIESLDSLCSNLSRFERGIQEEVARKHTHTSKDDKLQALIAQINTKRSSGHNQNNQKVLIFTVFKDTAFYLFDQLKARGFTRIAVVSGDEARTDDADQSYTHFEPLVERFAPYTKLFREREWKEFTSPPDPLSKGEGETSLLFGEGLGVGPSSPSPLGRAGVGFEAWKAWVSERHPHIKTQLDNPIDILIATDCLSEGQNLQDCDFVVNYDIHWNPVRVIQRMGRIDRLGSPNETIYGVNFWPSDSINAYLDLQDRIENRMIAMRLAGSEVDKHFTDTLKDRIEDEAFERSQKERMMRQMEISWEEIEVSEQGLGFEDLSLEPFRQDLYAELNLAQDKYHNMPNGVYTGFERDPAICSKEGIIALLGYPAKPSGVQEATYESYDLIYIDREGNSVLLNQRNVFEALAHHKDHPRVVPEAIDKGEAQAITPLKEALTSWLRKQAIEEEITYEGMTKTKMGHSARDVLEKLKTGDRDAIMRLKKNVTVEEKFQAEHFDLIVWFVVN